MSPQEVNDLMNVAEDAALNVDALLALLEDAAWAAVNHAQEGRAATAEDVARAASVHTAIMMARKQFVVCYQAISEGQNFASRLDREHERATA